MMRSKMRVIGITGGVGAGKSEVMRLIAENADAYILIADEAAHAVERKGCDCYYALVELLSEDELAANGEIDKAKMALKIFEDESLRERVNAIVHPAVKRYILSQIEEERTLGNVDFFFIEAALLIEDGYDLICDELWYVYADEAVRRERLRRSRGYTDAKIDKIIEAQSSDAVFRKYCSEVIENNGDLSETRRQVIRALSERSQ